MNTKRVVVFNYGSRDGGHLLSNIRRNDDGSIKAAWVVNGRFDFTIVGNVMHVGADRIEMPAEGWEEIPIPDHMNNGYNELIHWASQQ